MKKVTLAKISDSLTLKVAACILGVICWLKLTYNQPIIQTVALPLSFYNISASMNINAPEAIPIQLRATRAHLYAFNPKNFAIHIDAGQLALGKHTLAITAENLFLPDSITMVHCKPCNVEVLHSSIV